jgi:hypothetical protein
LPSSPAAAARRSSSSGIDDHRKKLIRLAISQPLSGFSALVAMVSTRYRNAGETSTRAMSARTAPSWSRPFAVRDFW